MHQELQVCAHEVSAIMQRQYATTWDAAAAGAPRSAANPTPAGTLSAVLRISQRP
jgi:hypothetical protein